MSGPLSRLLGLADGEALAVVGCGGKTGLIARLARENAGKKVLVMPTATIRPPGEGALVTRREAWMALAATEGLTTVGRVDAATGKLKAPPEEDWAALAARFDLTLMEADGSRGLPCKGWLESEPVVPPFAACTLGVVSTAALGRPANEENVLRLPRFLALTGLSEDEAITLEALAAMVAAPEGMFRRRAGRLALVVNQVESAGELEDAKRLVSLIRGRYGLPLGRALAGSVWQNHWQSL